jgi:hypothetical protein
MTTRPESLYLDLLKKTLSFTLWEEPSVPVEMFNYLRPQPRRALFTALAGAAHALHLELVERPNCKPADRTEGKVWPLYADTMVGLKRLDNIQHCVETALRENIPGDLLEAGVWRGGTSIFMRAILAAHGATDRRVFVCDSFQGLPRPDEARYPQDKGDQHHIHPVLAVSLEQVQANFKRYELLDDQVVFLKGWFKDTLPTAPVERLAVLRADGDMYESTMDILNNLYAKLSPGGFCVIDDYGLQTCKLAVDDFRTKHDIKEPLVTVDWTGAYWRKE